MSSGTSYILSFDCADKTLGVCIIGFSPKDIIGENLDMINDATVYKEYYQLKTAHDMLFMKEMWLFNLLPDETVRGTSDALRLSRLKAALNIIKKYISSSNIKIDNVLVEYQMVQNDLSRLISAAIIYEFASPDSHIINELSTSELYESTPIGIDTNIAVVMPAGKNAFHFHQSLSYSNIAIRYATNTSANKRHTSENFKMFLKTQSKTAKLLGLKALIFDTEKITQKKINHIADAFMQAVYWIITTQWR